MDFNRLIKFKEIHRGARAILICNGPSLNSTDLSGIGSRDILFGLNKIFLAPPGLIPPIKYLVAVNDKVIKQSYEQLREIKATKLLGNRAGMLLKESESCFYFNSMNPKCPRFSIDPIYGVHEGWTVTYAALQLIFFMGIRRVIIVGMDHSFVTDGSPANTAQLMSAPDINHFSRDYFKIGQSWDLPDLKQSEASYALARRVFESYGGEVIDSTLGGKCNVFRKLPLDIALRLGSL